MNPFELWRVRTLEVKQKAGGKALPSPNFQIGSPAWIRTTIHGSKGRCPTIRRPGIREATRISVAIVGSAALTSPLRVSRALQALLVRAAAHIEDPRLRLVHHGIGVLHHQSPALVAAGDRVDGNRP